MPASKHCKWLQPVDRQGFTNLIFPSYMSHKVTHEVMNISLNFTGHNNETLRLVADTSKSFPALNLSFTTNKQQ
jgi:hypothetical protein